jgi:hypothetical protein
MTNNKQTKLFEEEDQNDQYNRRVLNKDLTEIKTEIAQDDF